MAGLKLVFKKLILEMKKLKKWTAEEKERVIEDAKRLGVVAACKKHDIYATTYYKWVNKYAANGLEGLRDQRSFNTDALMKKKDKEIRLLKEIVAEKDLLIKMQEDLLKKKLKL